MSFEDLSKQFGFSRATYYRKRKILEELDEGKAPIRKLQRLKLRKWSVEETALVLKIDHMTVTKNGISFKHFQAWERKSKTIIAQIYSRARSSDAKKFLQHLIAEAPYKIRSIQVDGGSEFMLEFENACAELNIPLFVNQPATPKNNGDVERGNKTFREEFYANHDLLADSITALRSELQLAVRKYNNYRPHASLKGLTPSLYIQNYSDVIPSHFM